VFLRVEPGASFDYQLPREQDVHNVSARSSITVRVAFERFAGGTAYHCHILDHEDLALMGVLAAR
jgi:FtsP/CotA-like multicopper oxidase with cupredoxin domain